MASSRGSRTRRTPQQRRNPAYERPFEVSAQAIANLNSEQFVSFVTNLIQAEIAWYGGASTDLVGNFAPGADGGRDALTQRTASAKSDDVFVPLGQAIWQCKAERSRPGISEFADEVSKPRPCACLDAGGSYVFVAQNPANNEDDVEAEFKSLALSNGYDEEQMRFYAQTKLAGIARRHPSLSLLPYFQFRPSGLEPFELWEKDHASIPYESAAHCEALQALRTALRPGRFHIAVVGPTGVGKSRLVLEAVRLNGLSAFVAYARSPGPSVDRLVEHIQMHSRPCIVIVDECDHASASVLRDRLANTMAGLITIEVERDGIASRPPDGDALVRLAPLPDHVISKVLAGNAGLGEDARRWVASQAGGYIKLARLIGDELARDTSAMGHLAALSAVTEVERALLRMLGEDPQQVELMKLLSCFSSVEHSPAHPSSESYVLATKLGGITPRLVGSLISSA